MGQELIGDTSLPEAPKAPVNPHDPTLAEMEAWGGALLRAITGDASLQWSGQTLYAGTTPQALPAAHHAEVPAVLADQRGLLDSVGLRLSLSDAQLHRTHLPSDPIERLIFELLEQLRVESLVPVTWPGARENMRQRFLHWAQSFMDSGLTESDLGILLFAVALVSWSRLTDQEMPDRMSDAIEATRMGMSPHLGRYWVQLRRHREDQTAFSEPALAVARWVGEAVRAAQEEAPRGNGNPKRRSSFALPLHFESQNLDELPLAQTGDSRAWASSSQTYRVFTRKYDREEPATELIRHAQLVEFREQMDDEISRSGLHVGRIARYFQQRLATHQRDGWNFGLEEGHLDAGRLSQLVSDPQLREIFKDEMQRPINETAVTFLLDCSGSMKSYSKPMSILVDVLGRALDMAGARVEVLGFSTNAWNGGRVRRDWQKAGQPQFPGRLNERLHIIFKDAGKRWRHGRQGIAALRRPDIFREGIDGEGVDWACQRLLAQPARRRILMVISDGCPMDTATHQVNDEHYLDQHLRQVLAARERAGDVKVCALGVGLDLGVFYRQRLAVDLHQHVDEALLLGVAELLCRR
ncbi:cobaltochelatase CobT-related protein [Diaphorobacter caeni]|uniref:cobaltochelatase CobT-related protein n=1 Tax=Diaphorobacter caeni TaxID=2784387 RepID=UPI0018900433|nr:cobalt chelatase [Diaphorobacter caeni]MBF5003172.1 cobalt chelatase [Diaphorobacter caeni]